MNTMTPRLIVLSFAAVLCCADLGLAMPQDAKPQDKVTTPDKKSKSKDDPETIAKKIRSLEHQITVSRLQDQLDRQKVDSKRVAAAVAFDKAGRAMKVAAEALANFKAHTEPSAVESAKISLKSAQDSATHAADEYKELVAMYKADEFAEMTKELVLKRSRSRMALADRRLEVQKKALANLQKFTHPTKQAELQGKLADANAALSAATAARGQAELEARIATMKAEFKAAELVHDLAVAKKKARS